MKTTKLVMLVMIIAVAMFVLIPNLSWLRTAQLFSRQNARCATAPTRRVSLP